MILIDKIEITHYCYMRQIYAKVSFDGEMTAFEKTSAIKEWEEFSKLVASNIENIKDIDKDE